MIQIINQPGIQISEDKGNFTVALELSADSNAVTLNATTTVSTAQLLRNWANATDSTFLADVLNEAADIISS